MRSGDVQKQLLEWQARENTERLLRDEKVQLYRRGAPSRSPLFPTRGSPLYRDLPGTFYNSLAKASVISQLLPQT